MKSGKSLLTFVVLFGMGCVFSSTSGEGGKVDFTAKECGAVLGGLTGCDLKKSLAVGGKVSVTAVAKNGGAVLPVVSEQPQVLSAVIESEGVYTLTGLTPGSATLTAQNPTVKDTLPLKVGTIAQLAYSELSSSSGTFKLTPGEDADGMFELNKGLKQFTLLFGQIDAQAQQLIGRESTTYELSAGLSLAKDKQTPTGLQFDFEKPALGTYFFTVKAKSGGAQFKMKIIVKE